MRASMISDDKPVSGAVGQVARCETGDVAGTAETGSDGVAIVEASLGCYIVTLVSYPSGLEPVAGGPWTVELSSPGQVANVGFILQYRNSTMPDHPSPSGGNHPGGYPSTPPVHRNPDARVPVQSIPAGSIYGR